jgi:hypothetical protein
MASNYNANAQVDDGTCDYARDKFLGLYLGTKTCDPDGWNRGDFQFIISRFDQDVTKVEITYSDDAYNPSLAESTYHSPSEYKWIGTIDGNTLRIGEQVVGCASQFMCDKHCFTATLELAAIAILEGNQLRFSKFDFSLRDAQNQVACKFRCDVLLTRKS